MQEYNILDVYLLEALYLRMRPWDNRAPNLALRYNDGRTRCVVCGCEDLEPLTKRSYTNVSVFKSFRCKGCGKIMRSRKREPMDQEILANAL